MDFIILNLCLAVVFILALFAHRLGQKWLMLSLASLYILLLPEREPEDRSRFAAVARVVICFGVLLYLTVAWSAFCVAIANHIGSRPTVTWYWLYVAASLVWFLQLPYRQMNPMVLYRKVSTETRTVWDQTGYTFQSTLFFNHVILGLAILASIVLTIWPNLTLIPYGWVLNPFLSGLDAVDDLLKRYWWLTSAILAIALLRIFLVRTTSDPNAWRSWGSELDGVVMMAKTLSSEWAGYNKTEFRQAILESWGGATAEDCGSYVLVRNERYSYFEFHFMFGEQPNATLAFLYVRGLKELQGLWILGLAGKLALNLKPVRGNMVSDEAQKAAALLQRKFDLRYAD